MNEVRRWLTSGAEVNEGLRLLDTYAPNRFLSEMVRRAPVRFRERLVQALAPFSDIPHGQGGDAVPEQGNRPSKFRDQWPFLKDPACPMELKALAADKITAYENLVSLHEKLYNCITPEESYETAKNLLKNYRRNSLISAEFAYYKEHGTPLGKHPIFAHRQQLEKYRKMDIITLVAQQRRLQKCIWRIEAELRSGTRPDLASHRENRLARKKEELSTVDNLINSYKLK